VSFSRRERGLNTNTREFILDLKKKIFIEIFTITFLTGEKKNLGVYQAYILSVFSTGVKNKDTEINHKEMLGNKKKGHSRF